MTRRRGGGVVFLSDHELRHSRAAQGACRRAVADLDAETARREGGTAYLARGAAGRPRDARGRFVSYRRPSRPRVERLVRWCWRHWIVTTITLWLAYWAVRAGLARVPDEVWTGLGWALAIVMIVLVVFMVAVIVTGVHGARRARRRAALIEAAETQRAWSVEHGLVTSAALWGEILDHRRAAS